MIIVPDPEVDLVDDPGDPILEVYEEPSPEDLCPGCGGPDFYMNDGCCKYSYNLMHMNDYIQNTEAEIMEMMRNAMNDYIQNTEAGIMEMMRNEDWGRL
jgi:hypothetical protein